MNGLEAISAANGWAMSLIGAIIVMAGLALLSFIISLFPKAIALLEKSEEKLRQKKNLVNSRAAEEKPMPAVPEHRLSNIDEMASHYQPLIDNLGESFQLRELYDVSKKNDFPHPHLTIRTFREAGILVQREDGAYCWKK